MDVQSYVETQLKVYTSNGRSDLAQQLLTACSLLYKKTISADEFATIIDKLNQQYVQSIKQAVPKVSVPRRKAVAKKRKPNITRTKKTTANDKLDLRQVLENDMRRRLLLCCERLARVRREDRETLQSGVKIRKTSWPLNAMYAVDTITERDHQRHAKQLEKAKEPSHLIARTTAMSNMAYIMATENQKKSKTKKRKRPKPKFPVSTKTAFNIHNVTFADALRFAITHPPERPEDRLPIRFIQHYLERIQSGWSPK